MAQANLARARIADFDVFVTQDFGATGFVKADCFRHDSFSSLLLDLHNGNAAEGSFRLQRAFRSKHVVT